MIKTFYDLPWRISRILGVPHSSVSGWATPALGRGKMLLTAPVEKCMMNYPWAGKTEVRNRIIQTSSDNRDVGRVTGQGQEQRTAEPRGAWDWTASVHACAFLSWCCSYLLSAFLQTSAPSPWCPLHTAILSCHVTSLLFQMSAAMLFDLLFSLSPASP